MEVFGKGGRNLEKQWKESRGAQAYMGTYVHNFPNFAMLYDISLPYSSRTSMLIFSCRFGPNTFPAHNSVLFASEVQVEYLARTLISPIIDGRISSLEVKLTVENQWVNAVHSELSGSVFEAGCSNWYINTFGRNSASWPGYASTYWREALKPQIGVFKTRAGSKVWLLHTLSRWIRTTSSTTYLAALTVAAYALFSRGSLGERPAAIFGSLHALLSITANRLLSL